METEKRKNRKLSKIIIIVLSILFLGTLIPSVMLILKNNHLKDEYIKLDNNYKNEQKLNDDKNKEYSKIKNDIEEMNNLEDKISNEKSEYFKKIKELEDKILNGESDKKIAYLTFDDGPYYLTYDYLDVLDKYNVKATFFTIGLGKERCLDKKSVSCYPVYKEIVERGHTIANHTYSHAIWNGLYSSSDSFIAQVKKQEELIKNETGVVTNIVRFPGGSATARGHKNSIIEKLKEMNYGWVDWTSQDGDGGNLTSKEQALSTFKNSINDKIEVVLLHDYNHITLDVLPEIIEYLQNKGYILLPLFYDSNMINK